MNRKQRREKRNRMPMAEEAAFREEATSFAKDILSVALPQLQRDPSLVIILNRVAAASRGPVTASLLEAKTYPVENVPRDAVAAATMWAAVSTQCVSARGRTGNNGARFVGFVSCYDAVGNTRGFEASVPVSGGDVVVVEVSKHDIAQMGLISAAASGAYGHGDA